MKKVILILFFICFIIEVWAQDSSLVPVKFTFPNGKISSEGFLRDNKPDSYWKSYYESGFIKSEGNRTNYQLDGLWKFYADTNRLQTEIEYKHGLKNGKKTTYLANETIVENFIDDIKEGYSETFYKSGKIKTRVFFEKGLATGQTFEYDTTGRIITVLIYKKGYLVSREIINRYDKNNSKTSIWKTFFSNGNVEEEIYYRAGMKNGFYKKYNDKGTLLSIEKYVNDVKEENVAELKEYEIRKDYYPDGKVKIVGSYYNGIPDGVRREYDEKGNVVKGYIFESGLKKGEGITDNNGQKQGQWIEYHDDGNVSARGKYVNGNRVGEWKFYYPDSQIDQQGTYTSKGKPDGEWKKWNDSGVLIKEENFENGVHQGDYQEYNDSGKTIVKGTFEEGVEQGKWTYDIGDVSQSIEYQDGVMMGMWIQKDIKTGEIIYEGKYTDDEPVGKHVWYFPNGKKRLEGYYAAGERNGEWKYYTEDGQLFLSVTYNNGIEIKYNSSVIK